MVKVQDGSLIYAGQLISGEGQDDDGRPLKFEQADSGTGTSIPLYKAESELTDGSGRKKIYSFDLGTTQVRVSVSTVEPEEKKPEKEKEKEPEDEPTTKAKVVNTEMPKSRSRGAT